MRYILLLFLAVAAFGQTVVEFTPLASADDGVVRKTWDFWPVGGGTATVDTTNTESQVEYSFSSNFFYDNFFVRFDTSTIPDEAVISSAVLKLRTNFNRYVTDGGANFVYRGEYYSSWPIDSTDWVDYWAIGNNAFTSATLDTITNNTYLQLPLSNLENINKTGYTGFRIGLYRNSSQAPSGRNGIGFYTTDGSWMNKPILVVTYSVPPRPPTVTNITHPGSPLTVGTWYTFSGTYQDLDGYNDLNEMKYLINTTTSMVNACSVRVVGSSVRFYDNNGTSYTTGTLGSGGILSNTQCDFDPAASSSSCTGTNCTLSLKFRFKNAFAGSGKYAYGAATDYTGLEQTWTSAGSGSFTINPIATMKLLVVAQ